MGLSIIVAMNDAGVIGRNGQIPWHLPDDLRRFKQLTMGKTVLMGRKTYESLPGSLPGRRMIVLSKHWQEPIANGEVVSSWQQAKDMLGEEDAFVIGGAALYALALPEANQFYLTLVQAKVSGDVCFPEWCRDEWVEEGRQAHVQDDRHAYAFTFINYRRAGT